MRRDRGAGPARPGAAAAGARRPAGTRALARRASRTRTVTGDGVADPGARARIAVLAGLAVACSWAPRPSCGAAGVLPARLPRTTRRPGPPRCRARGRGRTVAGRPRQAARHGERRPRRLTMAERAADPGPARRAGLRLAADARAARRGPPPPLAERLYLSALTELDQAGRQRGERQDAGRGGQPAGGRERDHEGAPPSPTLPARAPPTARCPSPPGDRPPGARPGSPLPRKTRACPARVRARCRGPSGPSAQDLCPSRARIFPSENSFRQKPGW